MFKGVVRLQCEGWNSYSTTCTESENDDVRDHHEDPRLFLRQHLYLRGVLLRHRRVQLWLRVRLNPLLEGPPDAKCISAGPVGFFP